MNNRNESHAVEKLQRYDRAAHDVLQTHLSEFTGDSTALYPAD